MLGTIQFHQILPSRPLSQNVKIKFHKTVTIIDEAVRGFDVV